MVNFVLSGLNESVTQTTNLATQGIENGTATESTGPVLNLTMNASLWNGIFSIGENIYRTYSSELPELKHSITLSGNLNSITASGGNTLANGTHTSGISFTDEAGSGANANGTGGVISSITVTGNAVTSVIFSTSGSGYLAGNTITITCTELNGGGALGAYTVVAGDLNSAGGFISGSTLATKDITDPGTGAASIASDGVKLQEPEETTQTIADDVIRSFLFGIHNLRGQDGLYSNISTVNSQIDGLLTDTGGSDFVTKLKAKIDVATNTNGQTDNDGLTDSTTTDVNLSRQLKLICLANDPTRLTDNSATDIYHANNILSHLPGRLDNLVSGSLTDGVYSTGGSGNAGKTFSVAIGENGAGSVGTDVVVSEITVRGTKVAGIKFSNVGADFVVGNTLTFTTDIASTNSSVAFDNAYTIAATDIDNDGKLNKTLFNFLFEANDTLSFQCTIVPTGSPANQDSKNYNIKVTMA